MSTSTILTLSYHIIDFPSGIRTIKIAASKTISDLKKAIKARAGHPIQSARRLDPDTFKLWRVSIHTKDENWWDVVDRRDFEGEDPLWSTDTLSSVFPTAPPADHIHIMVETQTYDDPRAWDEVMHKRMTDGGPRRPWSKIGASEFEEMQHDESFLACARPLWREPKLPLALLHPVFGEFADNCKIIQITTGDAACAQALRQTMSDICPEKRYHRVHLNSILKRYGIPMSNASNDLVDRFSPTGHPEVICVVKEEIGLPGPEPSLQAFLDYRNSVRKSSNRSICHPCFILFAMGPHLGFGGCAWTDRATLEIFALVPLVFHSMNTDADDMLVRHLAALKKGVNTLTELYTKMCSTPSPAGDPRPSRKAAYPALPYKTEFTHLSDGQRVSFSYETEREGKSLIYFGRMEGNHTGRICIKFTRRYGRDAHAWCASQYFAPRLLGLEGLPGGWLMVVMEQLDDSWTPLHAAPRPHPGGLKAHIRAQVAALHSQGLVHGDLRPKHVLVRGGSAANSEVVVVGFDLAGRAGAVRYPSLVAEDLELWGLNAGYYGPDGGRARGWPDGAEGFGPILPEHDDEMVERLFSSV